MCTSTGDNRGVGGNEDRLTNLHESVIGHILSRLPTKDAVRTSILSRAWEHKWANLYNVDVDDKYELRFTHETFVDFMNRIHRFSGKLKSFRLTCWNFMDSRCLQAWISEVLRHDIECFEVNLAANGIVYPYSLLNSTSLRKLSLMQQIGTLHVAATNCFPNLTSLNISLLEIVNGDPNSSTVRLNFPVLETFTAIGTKWLKLKSVEIYAPSLTAFTSKPLDEGRDYDYSITIVSHRLTKFSCSYGLPENIILNGSSIVSATLQSHSASRTTRLLQTIGSRASNLINNFTNLEELELSGFMAEVSQLGPTLHPHDKLLRLSLLQHSVHVRPIKPLFDLLDAAPSLKFLTLHVFNLEDYNYGTMGFVPSCIKSHLEEVVFREFDCEVSAYNLAKFLLKTANQLKKFIIVGSYHRHKEIEKVLSTYDRCSPCLTIEVPKAY